MVGLITFLERMLKKCHAAILSKISSIPKQNDVGCSVRLCNCPLVGVVFSIRYILFVWHLRKVGIAVTGRIVQQREWHNCDNTFFIPSVQFTTQAGKRWR
jgi:hypothetical protein